MMNISKRTKAVTDADQAEFLFTALKPYGIELTRHINADGEPEKSISVDGISHELLVQFIHFEAELVDILEREEIARAEQSRPKPRKR